jgi:hypothetical protein
MKKLNEMTLTKLTPAEAYNEHIKRVRIQATIDRRTAESRADTQRVLDLYTNGAPRKEPVVVKPPYTEAAAYTVTHLPGGLEASKAAEKGARTRRERTTRVLDMSPEAVAKREARRARRAARRQRKLAEQG